MLAIITNANTFNMYTGIFAMYLVCTKHQAYNDKKNIDKFSAVLELTFTTFITCGHNSTHVY